MTRLSIVLSSALSLAFVACATEEPTPDIVSSKNVSELEIKTDKPDGDVEAQFECRSPGFGTCPDDASECWQRNDVEYDCGAPFRIDSTGHCNGGPGMFQHVEHWDQCDQSSRGACVRINYIGRYFLYCL